MHDPSVLFSNKDKMKLDILQFIISTNPSNVASVCIYIYIVYIVGDYPFPTCRRLLTQLQQATFKNIVAKEEIAHY